MPKPDFQFNLEDVLKQSSKSTLRDPFGSKDTSVYFASEEGNQQLALLEHLSRYSSLLSVVEGPQGSGKSRFLMEFVRHQGDSTVVSHVNTSMLMTAGQLLQAIYGGFADHFSQPPNETTFGPLLKFSHELEEKGQSSLILIDNAQELNTDAIGMLLDMMSLSAESQAVPHVVLFSELPLARNLDVYQSSRYEQLSHTFHLAPYSLEQTRAYLLHRVRAVGGGINLPFNDKQVTQIFLESGGYPGPINTIAQTMMENSKPTKTGKGFPLAHMALLSFVVLGILVAVLFSDQSEDNTVADRTRNVIPLSPRQGQSSEETIARIEAKQRNIGQENSQILPDVPTESSVLPAVSMATSLDSKEPNNEVEPQSTIPTAILAEVPLDNAVNVIPAEIPLENPVKTVPVVAEPKAEQVAIAPPDPFNKTQWWLSQNPNRYTLQLLGTHNIDTVKDFIRDQGSLDVFSYFKSIHDNKDWYVVVYGIYRNRSEAIAASESLPKDIHDLNPWARNARGIQDDIKKTQ